MGCGCRRVRYSLTDSSRPRGARSSTSFEARAAHFRLSPESRHSPAGAACLLRARFRTYCCVALHGDQQAHQGRGPADSGELREAAGVDAQALKREAGQAAKRRRAFGGRLCRRLYLTIPCLAPLIFVKATRDNGAFGDPRLRGAAPGNLTRAALTEPTDIGSGLGRLRQTYQ